MEWKKPWRSVQDVHVEEAARVWVIFIFLSLLGGILYLVSISNKDPYSLMDSSTHLHPQVSMDMEKKPAVRGTSLRGASAQRFLATLACFGASGKWIFDVKPRHIAWNVAGDPITDMCDRKHVSVSGNVAWSLAEDVVSKGGNWTVREELKWLWRTNSSCPMRRFDRKEMCRLIGRRNILLVGDSINQALQWTFLNHLLIPNATGIERISSACWTCEGPGVCGDVLNDGSVLKVGFIRNDHLSLSLNVSANKEKNFYEWPWVQYLKEWNVKILILNRGAHYEDDEIYTTALKQTLAFLRERYPQLLIFYRNTPPGHIHCKTYTGPLIHRQNDTGPINWHWGDFHRQNLLAKEIVESYGYIYVDVDAMLSLRPDGHLKDMDCLHYCIPGPMDSVVEMFYNIMRLL